MQYRRLGNSGLRISTVSIGGWINFGEGKVADETASAVVRKAYELGINFFDLADSYGKGRAEEQMGAVLKDFPRHTLVVSTKVFWPFSDDVNDRGLSRKHIMESIDRSLRRLQMDYVDLYFCHRPDPDTPIEETARAMDDLIHQGKVLYWGTSMWEADQLKDVYALCERYNLYKPLVEQPEYSMITRERVEQEIMPVVKERGMGLVVWSPLAMGLLTGKYDAGVPADSRFGREDWVRGRFNLEQWVEKVRQLKPIADRLGITRSHLALAWALRDESVDSVITGATRPEQVEENVRASEVALDEATIQEIEAVLGNG